MLVGGSSLEEDITSIIHVHRYFLKKCLDLGVGVITIEQQGVDGHRVNKQEFMEQYTRSNRLSDHRTVIEHLKKHPPKGWNGKLIFLGASEDSRWSDWPIYAQEKAKSVDWAKAEKSYKDARIKAVIAIAPDLGQAFTKDGLKKADVPILIMVGDQDRITPKKENAAFYAKGIKGADLEVIPGAEHFTFMKMCCSSEHKIKHVYGKVIHKIYAFLQKTFLQKTFLQKNP